MTKYRDLPLNTIHDSDNFTSRDCIFVLKKKTKEEIDNDSQFEKKKSQFFFPPKSDKSKTYSSDNTLGVGTQHLSSSSPSESRSSSGSESSSSKNSSVRESKKRNSKIA